MTEAQWDILRVDSISRRTEGPTLYVLPTIPYLVSMVSGWRTSVQAITVIAPLLTGCMDAMHFLTLLRDDALDERAACISFTDQLTSAIDAPVPVEFDGVRTYFSLIELIANGAHSFTLHVWAGDRFRRVQPRAEPRDVLLALHHYFRSCEALGDAWLLRGAQPDRLQSKRAEQARLRLRTFLSALMHASPNELSPTHYRIADRVLSADRQL